MINFFRLFLITLIPEIELRGAVPVAVASGYPLMPSLLFILLVNILIIPFIFIGLNLFFNHLSKSSKLSHHLEKVRKANIKKVEKYGLIGLALFVAVPLPGSGVYAGALLAWVLGLNKKYSLFYIFLSLTAGVLIAAILVILACLGVASFLSI